MAKGSVGYDLLVMVHVGVVVVGFASVCMTGYMANAARRIWARSGDMAPMSEAIRRFFSSEREIAGRIPYFAPPTGAALALASGNSRWLHAEWVVAAGICWVAAVVVSEALLWPATGFLRRCIQGDQDPMRFSKEAGVASGAAAMAAALYLLASVVMFLQPRHIWP